MKDHSYKKIELIGTSRQSIENAVQNALTLASESIRNIRWVEVTEIRGSVAEAQVDHWQVGVKLGFRLEGNEAPRTQGTSKQADE
jgi:flavin-binding protein dodecin